MRLFAEKTAENSGILFVYGTLRARGGGNQAELMGTARLLGAGKVNGILADLGAYPGAVKSGSPDDWIIGELYELEDFAEQIARLDAYEECAADSPQPHEYGREKTTITLENGGRAEAWIYWYQRPYARRIASGDWFLRAS